MPNKKEREIKRKSAKTKQNSTGTEESTNLKKMKKRKLQQKHNTDNDIKVLKKQKHHRIYREWKVFATNWKNF